jgi:threonine dehydrogenase-like Zn-dependent dehydrogenase
VKAWRFHGFGDRRFDEVPEPVCGPGHVIAEPLCIQPSVTEAQLAFGIPTLAYESIKRRLETEAPVRLFGHEFSARVVEVGEGLTRGRPGDRVSARAKLPCGSCPLCLEDKNHLCRKGPIIGCQLPGCFAERDLLPEIELVRPRALEITANKGNHQAINSAQVLLCQ